MARKLKISENEKYKFQDVKYGKKKLKKVENLEISTVGRGWNMARKLKIMENEKHALDDLKNDEITKKREK